MNEAEVHLLYVCCIFIAFCRHFKLTANNKETDDDDDENIGQVVIMVYVA
jgi:hypothetical protein